MSKIDRNWRVGCENGQQMNEVWQVLKDADEPMYTDTPNYSDDDYNTDYKVMVFYERWMGGSESNITFKEFMAIMKPETSNTDTLLHDSVHTPLNSRRISVTSEAKKEDVQYVTNLLDYLDNPELIQEMHGVQVRALHHFPDKRRDDRVLVVFETGVTCFYSEEGFLYDEGRYSFILKPKPREYVTGWRRRIICEDGSQILNLGAKPTKDEFMNNFKNLNNYRFGPWEEVVTEVCDE